mgnify:CR=1 FL=1
MELDTVYWSRQRDSYQISRENNALLREALLVLRLILSKIDGTPQMPTSPPSSSSPTVTPSTTRVSSHRLIEKMGRAAIVSIIMWIISKLGTWLLTLVLPVLVALGGLAWAWLGPFLKWAMG